jgi:DNA invertase Pin-like site-specific DNA recombinase
MAWSIDCLGRSLIDLLGTIQELEAAGVDLYLDQQSIDTTSPAGRLMFQVTGAFAEFERSMIRQRVKLGLKRAVAQGKKLGPRLNGEIERKAERQLRKGHGLNKIAKALGIGVGTVVRIKAEMPPETQASECPPKARGRSCAPFIHRGRPTSSFKRG